MFTKKNLILFSIFSIHSLVWALPKAVPEVRSLHPQVDRIKKTKKLTSLEGVLESFQEEARKTNEKKPEGSSVSEIKFKNLFLQTHKGSKVFFQWARPQNPLLPTLLLIPGAKRSFLIDEPEVQGILKRGFGVASMQFSVQALSVGRLEDNEVPEFKNRPMGLQDLAEEVNEVATYLKTHTLSNVVPISLSYSGAVSVLLKDYPLIVDTSPMTSERAANSTGAFARDALRTASMLNPFMSESAIRAQISQMYRNFWSTQLDSQIKKFKLSQNHLNDMLDGYVLLSEMAEDFTWAQQERDMKTRRVFILGAKEEWPLLENQLQTFEKIMASDDNALLIVFKETGHIISREHPEAYAEMLKLFFSGSMPIQSGVMIIDPKTGAYTAHPKGQDANSAESVLKKLLRRY